MEQTSLCTTTYVHGLRMWDSSIHQGQAHGFTTGAENISNHLGEVWGDNPCDNPLQLEASSSSVYANKAGLLLYLQLLVRRLLESYHLLVFQIHHYKIVLMIQLVLHRYGNFGIFR